MSLSEVLKRNFKSVDVESTKEVFFPLCAVQFLTYCVWLRKSEDVTILSKSARKGSSLPVPYPAMEHTSGSFCLLKIKPERRAF